MRKKENLGAADAARGVGRELSGSKPKHSTTRRQGAGRALVAARPGMRAEPGTFALDKLIDARGRVAWHIRLHDGREITVGTNTLRDHGSVRRIFGSLGVNLAPMPINDWLGVVDTALRPLRRGRP